MLDDWVHKPRQRCDEPCKKSLTVERGNDSIDVTSVLYVPRWLSKGDMGCRVLQVPSGNVSLAPVGMQLSNAFAYLAQSAKSKDFPG